MDFDSETVMTALQSGDADRVNDVLDAVEDAENAEKVRLLSDCFEDCGRLYDDADDGYVRQSVVRFLAATDPNLAVDESGEDELAPDDLNLTDDEMRDSDE